jgi:protein TonB
MFEQTFLVGTAKTRRAWTVSVCFAGQLAAVGCMVLVPLVFFDGLPQARLAPPVLTVPGTYRPPAPPPHVRLVGAGSEPVEQVFRAPLVPPKGIHLGLDRPATAPPDLVPVCIGVCVPGGVDRSGPVLLGQRRLVAPPFEPPVEVEPVVRPTPTPAPIRVNSGVQEAKLIHRVMPVYPQLAIRLRICGAVHLAAIIGADGRIRELQVLGGHPLLVPAAVDAVREWVYQPTMLSGTPVEVMTDILVTFSLSQR